eukprot:m.221996 g.221996  ORF g.221996 m.221996 type:complete len:321 (+) comp39970_c0_seq5:3669-4631(+)
MLSSGTTRNGGKLVKRRVPISPSSNKHVYTTTLHSPRIYLLPHYWYFAGIRCYSQAGLTTFASSNGIMLDVSPPIPGRVYDLCPDFCEHDSTQTDFSPKLDELRFRWEGFHDPHSGIWFYEWNYSQNRSQQYLLPNFRRMESSSSEVREHVQLKDKIRYCVTVKAVNKAGLKTEKKSNGLITDTSPPTVSVKDGNVSHFDFDYQASVANYFLSWPAITDPTSYISSLEVGLGSKPGKVDIVSLRPVYNDSTSFTFQNLNLRRGHAYFGRLCAKNGARLVECASTDGVLVITSDWHSFIPQKRSISKCFELFTGKSKSGRT